MIQPGILLDTGPLVSLLFRNDNEHERAKNLFAKLPTPFRTCESVISETCFLLKKANVDVIGRIISLGEEGMYQISFSLAEHMFPIRLILDKYQDQPISLADACLIRCAEIYSEPRILTFDSDFEIYRWGRNRRFEILS